MKNSDQNISILNPLTYLYNRANRRLTVYIIYKNNALIFYDINRAPNPCVVTINVPEKLIIDVAENPIK
jgi:hypothetical protein